MTADVPCAAIPPLLLRTVPETAGPLAELFRIPADGAVLSEDACIDLYEILLDCFARPVLVPQLASAAPDAGLLDRCWGFVERVVDHPSEHVSGAVYFQVLEQLLDAEGLVAAAWPHMRPRTRARTLRMLDFYGVRVHGINDRWARR
ncbi:hypothetical protein [Streptomyces sp. AD55]|uniref:hypothetical protein n=1 Tax=Streptomyces sp. AD55 TaxID=3242895 RepID=UPI003528C7C8